MKFQIKEAREQAGYSQKELAEIVGVAPNTFHGYESGKHDPKSDLLVKIAAACRVSTDFLLGRTDNIEVLENKKTAPSISDEAIKVAKDYEGLDYPGRHTVRVVIDAEQQRIAADQESKMPEPPAAKIIPLFGNSFAAGRGDPDFGNAWEDYEVPSDSAADFAIRVNGDSMEPYLPDGSIALGRKQTPFDGDVAALLLDGEFLVKQVCQDCYDNLYLFSLNRSRSDADVTIMHDSGRTVTCFGTIIMKERVPLP